MVWEVGGGLDAGQVVHGCTGWSGTACALALPRHSPRGTNSCSVAARPTYSPRRSTTTRTAAWIGRSCEICSIVSVGTRAGLSRGSSSTSWSSLCTTRTPTARRRKRCLGKGGNSHSPIHNIGCIDHDEGIATLCGQYGHEFVDQHVAAVFEEENAEKKMRFAQFAKLQQLAARSKNGSGLKPGASMVPQVKGLAAVMDPALSHLL